MIIFLENQSNMCETKTFLVSLSSILLLAASFCIYQAHTQNKVGESNGIKNQRVCENVYKNYCSNAAECYYLVDEDSVGCKCAILYAGKRCKKYLR